MNIWEFHECMKYLNTNNWQLFRYPPLNHMSLHHQMVYRLCLLYYAYCRHPDFQKLEIKLNCRASPCVKRNLPYSYVVFDPCGLFFAYWWPCFVEDILQLHRILIIFCLSWKWKSNVQNKQCAFKEKFQSRTDSKLATVQT